MTPFRYETATPKRKHHWTRDEAAIIRRRDEWEAMCPSSVTREEAERALVDAVPWSPPGWSNAWPRRLYNAYNGIVYRAVMTRPGSYHAFPDREADVPRKVLQVLQERAARAGETVAFAPEADDDEDVEE